MRALTITRHGGPEVLRVLEAADPIPGPGEIRIRVARAGLNFADVSARVGLYPDAPRPPMVMGYEVSGTVDAVGPRVEGFSPGSQVLAFTRFGGQATHVTCNTALVLPLPPGMSLDAAAAFPVVYLTAYHLLHRVGHVRPGSRVLVHMAAGGVGLAVAQLCGAVGEVTVFGTASASKHALLREEGVAHPIDYKTVDYADEVRRLTAGRGVDLVLDSRGGPDWDKGYGLLAPAGQLLCYGWANMVKGPARNPLRMARQLFSLRRWTALQLMDQNRGVAGVNIGHLWGETELLLGEMQALLALHARGAIRPRVDSVFPLAEGAAAHRQLQEGRNVGKVLFDCA